RFHLEIGINRIGCGMKVDISLLEHLGVAKAAMCCRDDKKRRAVLYRGPRPGCLARRHLPLLQHLVAIGPPPVLDILAYIQESDNGMAFSGSGDICPMLATTIEQARLGELGEGLADRGTRRRERLHETVLGGHTMSRRPAATQDFGTN